MGPFLVFVLLESVNTNVWIEKFRHFHKADGEAGLVIPS